MRTTTNLVSLTRREVDASGESTQVLMGRDDVLRLESVEHLVVTLLSEVA